MMDLKPSPLNKPHLKTSETKICVNRLLKSIRRNSLKQLKKQDKNLHFSLFNGVLW